nr:hypothetical protein [Methylosinus sp. Sm6]
MDEVRNIGPEGVISFAEPDRRPEAVALHAHPQFAQLLGGQLAILALGVDLALEAVEGDLPHHRVQHVLHLGGEQGALLLGLRRAGEQRAEGQHLAEHRGRLGQRQRRRRHQRALRAREHLMHAMAELMGQRHHIARLALEIDQNVRMHGGHGRMGEGARRLAGPHRRVDPIALEEARGDLRHARRKARIGREHDVARLVPGIDMARHLGQRRVAVPMIERLLAEPFGLELVIAMRELGMGGDDARNQRLDHLGLDAIGEMARVGDIVKAAPAVGNLLVLGERVGHQREDAQIGLQRRAHRQRRLAPHVLIRVLHQSERGLERQLLAADREAQRGDGLVEQAIPGGAAGHRLLVEEPLQLVGELIGLLLANILEPGAPARQRSLCGGCVESGVVETVELKLEEQQLRRNVRDLALHVAIEFGARGVAGVAAVDEAGIGHDSAEEFL